MGEMMRRENMKDYFIQIDSELNPLDDEINI